MVLRLIPSVLMSRLPPMCRPRREFKAESFVLEERSLLAVAPHLPGHCRIG
jgi:hypothetical protein